MMMMMMMTEDKPWISNYDFRVVYLSIQSSLLKYLVAQMLDQNYYHQLFTEQISFDLNTVIAYILLCPSPSPRLSEIAKGNKPNGNCWVAVPRWLMYSVAVINVQKLNLNTFVNVNEKFVVEIIYNVYFRYSNSEKDYAVQSRRRGVFVWSMHDLN